MPEIRKCPRVFIYFSSMVVFQTHVSDYFQAVKVWPTYLFYLRNHILLNTTLERNPFRGRGWDGGVFQLISCHDFKENANRGSN